MKKEEYLCLSTDLSEYIFQRIIILFMPPKVFPTFDKISNVYLMSWLQKYARNFIHTCFLSVEKTKKQKGLNHAVEWAGFATYAIA